MVQVKYLLNIVDCFNEKGYRVHVILFCHGNLDDKLIHKVHDLITIILGFFEKNI